MVAAIRSMNHEAAHGKKRDEIRKVWLKIHGLPHWIGMGSTITR